MSCNLFVFIILVLFIHVELSACRKIQNQVQTKRNSTRNRIFKYPQWFFEEVRDKRESSKLLGSCSILAKDICRLECKVTANNRQGLINELETQYKVCKKPMKLTLKGTPFANGQFSKADLDGDFKLKYLKIEKCDKFLRIEDNAFNKSSLNDLEELIIIQMENNGIETMNENTFAGLNKLTKLDFRNTVVAKKLTVEAALKTLAANLTDLKFEQTSKREGTGYDPGIWFTGAIFTNLTEVDLRNNYFRGKWRDNAFENLESVVGLHLAGCAIETIDDSTIWPILETLKYLDLSNNELTTLSPTILSWLSWKFVDLNLIGNNWDCSCDNWDFMYFMLENRLFFHNSPTCKTPKKWENEKAVEKAVELNCQQQSSEAEGHETTKSTTEAETGTTKPTTEAERETTKSTTTTEKTTKSTTEKIETTSTTSIQTTTTANTENTSEILLFCALTSSEDSKISLQDQLTYFHISSVSATSVLITFLAFPTNHDLFYFTTNKADSNHQKSIDHIHVLITELCEDCIYIFCLISKHKNSTTPFDCRAHAIGETLTLNDNQVGWLSNAQRAGFLGSTIALTIICFIIGVFGTYFMLRFLYKRKGSKYAEMESIESKNTGIDLSNASTNSTNDSVGCVKLITNFARKFKVQIISLTISTKARSKADKQRKSDNYLKYKRSSELSSTNLQAISLPENLPPLSRAPALPPLHARQALNIVCLPANNDCSNENIYQSLDDNDGRIYETARRKNY